VVDGVPKVLEAARDNLRRGATQIKIVSTKKIEAADATIIDGGGAHADAGHHRCA